MKTFRQIILSSILLLMACPKIEKVYLLPDRDEIVDAIYHVIKTDGVFSLDGLNDIKAYFLDYTSTGLSKMTFPDTADYDIDDIKIGRQITQISDTVITYDIKWDSAYVDVKYLFKGNLKIVLYDIVTDSTVSDVEYINGEAYDTTGYDIDSLYIEQYNIWLYDTTYIVDTSIVVVDSVIIWAYQDTYSAVDSTTKSFNHRTEQKAIFLRTTNTNNAAKDWKLKKITPMIFEPVDESFTISAVQLAITGTPTSIILPEDDDTALLETYFVRDSLPEIDYPGTVTISSVTVDNSDPYPKDPGELVVTHFGHEVNVYKVRTALSDSDNNGTHNGSFTVNSHGPKVYQLFIDAIDYSTIFTRTGSYNAHLIMLPFSVP